MAMGDQILQLSMAMDQMSIHFKTSVLMEFSGNVHLALELLIPPVVAQLTLYASWRLTLMEMDDPIWQ